MVNRVKRMKPYAIQHILVPVVILVIGLTASSPLLSQEEAEAPDETETPGELYIELEVWVPQPVGTEYFAATQQVPDNEGTGELLDVKHGTDQSIRYEVGYTLPAGLGTVSGNYWSHGTDSSLEGRAPGGLAVFGEIVVHPLYAGFNNDGLSDSFAANTRTRLREWRIDFSRTAFRTPKFAGEWSVGWRDVTHIRDMNVAYRMLLPDLPALIPPAVDCDPNQGCPDLTPQPDEAQVSSTFSGRGLGVGFDLDYHVFKDKVLVEAGLNIAVLRGKTETYYRSRTHAYFVGDNLWNPPYDEFGNGGLAAQVSERTLFVGLDGHSIATSSDVMEAYAGFRWRALPWFDVFGGFRQTRYTDVGVDLRPKITTLSPDDYGFEYTVLGIEDVTEVRRSVLYEGFYGGVTFRVK
jgi:hypothetical protein